MSIDQAKAFLMRVDEDQSVREAAQAAYTDELLKLARKLGYHIGPDDLKNAIAELTDVGDDVSLQHLEQMAGGVGWRPTFGGKGPLGDSSL